MSTNVKTNGNGDPVQYITYAPNGTNHELQRKISDFMHTRVMEVGKFTLAELGYLHMNTLTYESTGNIYLRIYFDARMAARRKESQTNRSSVILPVEELNIFQNYFFVGDLREVVTFEKIMAPKTSVTKDEMNRASLRFKDSNKYVETNALVLNCNLALTMAAVHDINLGDPEFTVRCSTVGKGGKNSVKSIVTTANMKEVPVSVTITMDPDHNNCSGYDPSGALPYLIALQEEQENVARNRDKIQHKVRKDAKTNKKASERKNYAGFNKYS